MDVNGIILVDKPAGLTSFGVVARVRRRLSEYAGKKVKVGHTGTLDPFATGLMILVVGTYCRRAGEFSKLDKSYDTVLRLGQTSSTGDPEGQITDISRNKPTKQEIQSALVSFTGIITQTPPIYSAIKIDGQRAYKLARAGRVVDMPRRTVTISRLDLVRYQYPRVYLQCDVSSGTYIRTLAADIGQKVATGAYTSSLRRTRVGTFVVDDAIQWDAPDLVGALRHL